MAVAYPFQLRTILRASKSRSQPAAFTVSAPRRGYAYRQKLGTDAPLMWDVRFAFTQDEAVIFRLWFKKITDSGVEEVVMPIRTEFGTVSYTVQFLPDRLMDTGEEGELFTYQATIMARAEVFPPGYEDAAELIVGLPDWTDWARLLDLAMTQEMPAA